MEHLGGETLRSLIRQRAPVSLGRRLALIEGACAGLAHAHRASVVHLDVKPDNLMLDVSGVLKVLDFGIARVLKSGVLMTMHVAGTLRYMSPEQVRGEPLDHRSDVFSLGCSLFELIAYEPAFAGSAHELITRIAEGPVPRLTSALPSVDPRLDALVARAMDPDPTQRFDDLDELGTALDRLSLEFDPEQPWRRAPLTASSAPTTVPFVSRTARPPARLVLASVGGVSAVAVGTAIRMLGRTPKESSTIPPAPAGLSTSAPTVPSDPPGAPAAPVASETVARSPAAAGRAAATLPPKALAVETPAASSEEVWRRLARGDRAGVIELLRLVERREADPPIAHEVLDAVRPTVLQARAEAAASPAQRASAAYRSADEGIARANVLAQSRQPIEALSALWQAMDLFASAPSPSPGAAIAVPAPVAPALPEPPAIVPADANARPARTPPDTNPVTAPPSESDSVLAALHRYHQAYTARDAAAVRQMYPTLGADRVEQLRKSFETISAYEVELRQPRIEVNDNTAVVHALVARRIVPRVGRPVTSEVDSEFRLQRDARGWLIVDVKAAP